MSMMGDTAKRLAAQVAGAMHRALHPAGLEHYQHAVHQDARTRNPVVVIHGIMGARLEDKESGVILWGGADRNEYADPTNEDHLRSVAFPVRGDAALHEREDTVDVTGSIHSFKARLAGLPLSVPAYGPILEMLGVGGFLKEEDTRAAAPLGYDHRSVATCFEFFFDWRRSVPDNAARLKRFIENVLVFSRYDARLPSDRELKVDIVAHSMGGLLARYFLRYGAEPMPDDGRTLDVTWAGADLVENAILVGTPSAGSIMGIEKLIGGLPPTPATPGYHAGLLQTFPSIYQLLPRTRHEPAIDARTGEPLEDLFDVELWRECEWGLCGRDGEDMRRVLLPDVDTDAERLRICVEHVDACLTYAKRFAEHMDRPGKTPERVALHLFAGDGVSTPRRVRVAPGIKTGSKPDVVETGLGDGTVLRASALMDERRSPEVYPRVLTPVHWTSVSFVPAPHMVLTRHPSFINNALYILLEKPRPGQSYAEGSMSIDAILREQAGER